MLLCMLIECMWGWYNKIRKKIGVRYVRKRCSFVCLFVCLFGKKCCLCLVGFAVQCSAVFIILFVCDHRDFNNW
jgi:hypothetical protein